MDDEVKQLWAEFVNECKEWVAFLVTMKVNELSQEDIHSLQEIEKVMAMHIASVKQRRKDEEMRLAEEKQNLEEQSQLEEGKEIEEQDEQEKTEAIEDKLSDLSLSDTSGNSPFPPFQDEAMEFEDESQTIAEQGPAGDAMN